MKTSKTWTASDTPTVGEGTPDLLAVMESLNNARPTKEFFVHSRTAEANERKKIQKMGETITLLNEKLKARTKGTK